MRTLQQFIALWRSYNLPSLIGPISFNKCGSSCALLLDHVGKNRSDYGGVFLTQTTKPLKKTKLKNKTDPYTLHQVRRKKRDGNYLNFEYVKIIPGRDHTSPRLSLKRNYSDDTNFITYGDDVMSVAVSRLSYFLKWIMGGNGYAPVIQPATDKELAGIRRELRTMLKGKYVVIIVDNQYNDYKEQYEYVKKMTGLFCKKPVIEFTMNNTLHARNVDYLTFQLFQY